MQILLNQCLISNSLLSYKARVSYSKIESLINHINESTRMLGFEIVAPISFTFKEISKSGEDSIIDIEFLIPVNKEFESNEFYVYKPKLRILNAARLRHTDSLISLSASKKALQHYIIDNDLSAVTDFYFQIIKLDFDTVVDIYVGLNENIV